MMTTTATTRPPAAQSGEDKLIAVARHIARTIGRTDTMTDDIIQIFSSFDRRFSRENLEPRRGAAAADRKVRALDRKASLYLASTAPIWSGCESEGFLRAVDGIIEACREVHAAQGQAEGEEEEEAYRAVVEAADGLLHRVMLRMEDEFRILMDQCNGDGDGGGESGSSSPGSSPPRSPREHSTAFPCSSSTSPTTHDPAFVADYSVALDCLPWGTMSDLYEIAKRMSAAGYGKACALAYSVPRLASLQDAICRLGFQPHWTTEAVHARPWPDLADEIRRWTRAAKVAFRVLFPSERRLCDRVFPPGPLSPVADLAFADVCRDPALGILGFADAVAVGSKAPDRLFALVEMYETLRDLVPDVHALFAFAPDEGGGAAADVAGCRFVRSEAATVCARLGVTVRGMLAELEGLVRRDPAPANKEKEALAAFPGGGVHPITRYVLNYLRTVSASARTLEEILLLEDDDSAGAGAGGGAGGAAAREAAAPADAPVGPASALARKVAWITEILVTNLEEKSKAYRDPALAYLFLMNNGRYMIQKAKGTELGQLLGDEWLHLQSSRLRQWHGNYQKTSWSKLVALLQHLPDADGAGAGATGSSSPSAKSLRTTFRRFNACLEELCEAQAAWVVADEQLRAEIRIAAVGMVLPAYRNFVGRARALEAGRQQHVVERCVKYAPEDVEAKINAIFQGSWKKP